MSARTPALATLFAVAALALLPSQADAGTAAVRDFFDERSRVTSQDLLYRAAPGEQNRVTLFFDASGRAYEVVDTAGVTPGRGCSRPDPSNAARARCPLTARGTTGGPEIRLGDRDDAVTVANVPARLVGGEGHDVLRGAGRLGSAFTGGPGNDTMIGGSGLDVFGEDRARNGSDVMDGRSGGSDEVSYADRRRAVRADLSGDRDDGERGERDRIRRVERLRGGRGSDRLTGNAADNVLVGGPGSDALRGGAGDDELGADTGRLRPGRRRTGDRLHGGSGNDTLMGSAGANVLTGGAGSDVIVGGRGNDRINARDRSIDELGCDAGRDTAVLDAFDYFADRCETVRRTRAAAATILDATTTAGGGVVAAIELGCPRDAMRVCPGRVALREGRRTLGERRFRLRRARREFFEIRLPRDAATRLGRRGGLRVTIVLRTLTTAGARRTITLAVTLPVPTNPG